MKAERGTRNNPPSSFIPHPFGKLRAGSSSLLWVMVGILLTAAALRMVGITHISPPGITHDEVAHWLINQSILAGEHAVYFTSAYGHEAGYHYWQALLGALIGDNALSLRLASAYLGVVGVAVSFVLARKLFGWQVGVMAAGITAVLFFPVFYSRLGLRAISLPVLSGLSAYFWWRAWGFQRRIMGPRKITSTPHHPITSTPHHPITSTPHHPITSTPHHPLTPSPHHPLTSTFILAGLLAGLSLYTYMAARAVPIFYGLFIAYLALFHRQDFKRRWRGVLLFAVTFAVTTAPLAWYLLNNPGAEFRISELDAPLRALGAGDLRPILTNAFKIGLGFGFIGDPLWRQGVAGMPVFGPVVAFLFYLSLPLCLWRWRDARYGFLLLWLATAVVPSLVTINAPSAIRMINLLPILGIFPALVIHNISQLSTVIHVLSTGKAKIGTVVLLIFGVSYACWTAWSIFVVWPQGGDVPFVWQTALRDIGQALDEDAATGAAAVGGWSPDTMDPATMQLYLKRDDLPVSTFGLEPGDDIIYTLVIPRMAGETAVAILHPTALPLHPAWVAQLTNWGAETTITDTYTQYTLQNPPTVGPQHPADTRFGDSLQFLGYDLIAGELVTYWQVTAPISQPMRLFVHALDENGEIIAEDYRWDTADPQNLWQPHWQVGDLILQKHKLAGPDASQLRLGIFNPYTCTPGPCENMLTESGEPFILIPQ